MGTFGLEWWKYNWLWLEGPCMEVFTIGGTDKVSVSNKQNFRIPISFGQTSSCMHILKFILGTGMIPSVIREKVDKPNWIPYIPFCGNLRLRTTTNQILEIVDTFFRCVSTGKGPCGRYSASSETWLSLTCSSGLSSVSVSRSSFPQNRRSFFWIPRRYLYCLYPKLLMWEVQKKKKRKLSTEVNL